MQQDIRGVLHAHTDLSDGVNTLEEMAEAVRQRGYEYFGVADHSQSVHYAGGLSLEEIGIQHAAIDRLNRKYGSSFRIFKGVESDILPDGSLDYTRTTSWPASTSSLPAYMASFGRTARSRRSGFSEQFRIRARGKVPFDPESLSLSEIASTMRVGGDVSKRYQDRAFMNRLNRTRICGANPRGLRGHYMAGGHGVMFNFPDDVALDVGPVEVSE